MKLDYNEAQGTFLLWLPRGEGNPIDFTQEYGLDWSAPDSTEAVACLYTREPYCALTFRKYATGRALAQLGGLAAEVDASWAKSSDRHIAVPADKELWPFQIASLDYALRRQHTLIGDEPGLGKTEMAIAFANEIQAKRVIVVCPASIRRQWVDRIGEWSTMTKGHGPGGRPAVCSITSSKLGIHPTAEWTVISWELCRSPGLHRALRKGRYDLLIVDEVHYAKNIKTKRSRAVFGFYDGRTDAEDDRDPLYDTITSGLAERCDHILPLSGTPLPSRPREAYVIGRSINWDAFDWLSEQAFRERYNPIRTGRSHTGKTYTEEAVGRTAEMQNRMRANFMTRHLKREVMDMLKMPIYDLIYLDEDTTAVKQALAVEKLLDLDGHFDDPSEITVDGDISTARKIMGMAMAPQVADYVEMLVEGGEDKLVVFAWHIEVLNILERALWKYGTVRIDGSDTAKQKDMKRDAFIQDPRKRIILGNILSLGTGVDGLQRVANHALIAEPDWVLGNNIQCFDRLDRGGQTRQVQGDIFVVPGSIAEKVLASALKNGQIVHKALDRQVA